MHCLVADPAWRFGDSLPGKGRGASKHYACMPVADICAMELPVDRREPGVLFLWRVAAMQNEALAVIAAWGYTLKSELVWLKQTTGGKRSFGMGHYVRASHETCLIATRGKGVLPATRSQRSVFEAPVGVHSEKPGAFYRIVEEMYPHTRRVEMFARTVRQGFEQHGHELGKLGAA